jgi:hypothetical protein
MEVTGTSLVDRCLVEARELVGTELDRTLRRKNLEASRSGIKRYAYGIGDDNPLWCDEQYAGQSKYGKLVAPPTYIFSVDDTAFIEPRVPGMSLLHAEDEIEFFRPILRDEQITSSCRIIQVEEKQGRRVPRMVSITGELTYLEPESKEIFAIVRAVKLRAPHAGKDGGLNYEQRPPYEYSDSELEAIKQAIFDEERRGAIPRCWDEIEVGDDLVPVVKGPLSLRDMICYYAGNGVAPEIYRAHELAYKGHHLDPPKHVDASQAHVVGMPGAYDIGHQRVGWVSHLLTNWMGDDGFLKKLRVRITEPNVLGDTTWCHGKVEAKYIVEGDHVVVCGVWTENQLGRVTASGMAVVSLSC